MTKDVAREENPDVPEHWQARVRACLKIIDQKDEVVQRKAGEIKECLSGLVMFPDDAYTLRKLEQINADITETPEVVDRDIVERLTLIAVTRPWPEIRFSAFNALFLSYTRGREFYFEKDSEVFDKLMGYYTRTVILDSTARVSSLALSVMMVAAKNFPDAYNGGRIIDRFLTSIESKSLVQERRQDVLWSVVRVMDMQEDVISADLLKRLFKTVQDSDSYMLHAPIHSALKKTVKEHPEFLNADLFHIAAIKAATLPMDVARGIAEDTLDVFIELSGCSLATEGLRSELQGIAKNAQCSQDVRASTQKVLEKIYKGSVIGPAKPLQRSRLKGWIQKAKM